MLFERITVDINQMDGEPCIRNLRIPVATIVSMLSQGTSKKQILEYFPDLEKDDIATALMYAAEAVREHQIPLTKAV